MKHILTIAALALSAASFGQTKPTQLPKSNRAFAAPFALYTVVDTAKIYHLGIYAIVDDNSGTAAFKYGLFDSHNKVQKEGFYLCSGNCYVNVYDANDSDSAFQILVDSVIHQPVK